MQATRYILTVMLLVWSSGAIIAQDDGVVTEEIVLGKHEVLTGTYTNLAVPEGEIGLFGAEIRIAVTGRGYQATIQLAEGEPSDLHVGDVEFDVELKHIPLGTPLPPADPAGISVLIDIPYGQYQGVFSGHVGNDHLVGTLVMATGREMRLDLPRGKGYWED